METKRIKWKRPDIKPAAAIAVASGALAAGTFACGAIHWSLLAALLISSFVLLNKRSAFLFFFGMAAVIISFLTGEMMKSETGFNRPVSGKMILRIEDSRISSLPELSGSLHTAIASLQSFTETGSETCRKYENLKVFVNFGKNTNIPPFGTLIESTGTLTPVEFLKPGTSGFDFPLFLRQRKCRATVWIYENKIIGRDAGIHGKILDNRDKILSVLFSGMKDTSAKRLAAALFCGVSSGMPEDLRREFSTAGIVHLFSVSGMHVAVLAMFLGLILRAMPFRIRYPLLTAAVWLYVLGTGAATPAMRAGLMVTIWALLKMNYLHLSGFDVLCWTATILLIANPLLPSATGAQYSFLITGVLLLFSELCARYKPKYPTPEQLIPMRLKSPSTRRMEKFKKNIKMLPLGSALAFAAGSGISLASAAHRLMPGAILANILVAALLPGYFILFFVQLFAGCCGCGRFTAPIFEGAFSLLRFIAAITGKLFSAWNAIPPHWSLIALYSAALLTALRTRKRTIRITAVTVAAASIVMWLITPATMPSALMVKSAGSGEVPMVVVTDSVRKHAVIINLPTPGSAAAAAEFIKMRGIQSVEIIGTSAPGSATLRGLQRLSRELPVKRLRLMDDSVRRYRNITAIPKIRYESAKLHRDLFQIKEIPAGFQLDYSDPGSKLCFVLFVTDGDDGRYIAIKSSSQSVAKLPWSIYPGVWKYEFK